MTLDIVPSPSWPTCDTPSSPSTPARSTAPAPALPPSILDQEVVHGDFSPLDRHAHCLLVTYKRDGSPIAAPVWFARDADTRRLYIWTEHQASKAKRLARPTGTARAVLATRRPARPADRRPRPRARHRGRAGPRRGDHPRRVGSTAPAFRARLAAGDAGRLPRTCPGLVS